MKIIYYTNVTKIVQREEEPMKCKTILLMTAMLLGVYVGLSSLVQARWNSECTWVVAVDTPVYTPGTADEIAVMLPAGTGCRVDASVGDTWQAIEYMVAGKTCTGMVRAEALRRRQ